jgi:hypothetical protein
MAKHEKCNDPEEEAVVPFSEQRKFRHSNLSFTICDRQPECFSSSERQHQSESMVVLSHKKDI